MIRLADYVAKYIENLGIDHVFTVSGGGCMFLTDAFSRCEGIKLTPNLHEQCSAICADGYSQSTGKLGVCLVTTGPGGTNAITGVAGSFIDSVPVLVISGQVKLADLKGSLGVRQKGMQEVDIVSIVKSITKYSVTVTDPKSIKYHLDAAITSALTPRQGPVWLDIPLDIQNSLIDECDLIEYSPSITYSDYQPLAPSISKVLELLKHSKRPVLLVGNGAKHCQELIDAFVSQYHIPVLTTWRSIDFFDELHPCYIGRPGLVGQRAANFCQQFSDLLIAIGARLDLGQVAFNYSNFAPNATHVVVDCDSNELLKYPESECRLCIHVDSEVFMNSLLASIDDLGTYSTWLERCKEWKHKYPVNLYSSTYSVSVNPYNFIEALSKYAKRDDIIVPCSAGYASEITLQSFQIKKGQRLFNSPGLGSMGYGVPHSIGASFGNKNRRVVCIVGDGSLQHNLQELELIRRYQLPIKIFVLNNKGYHSIRVTQTKFFDGRLSGCDESSGLTLPSVYRISQLYDIQYHLIGNDSNLSECLKEVLSTNDPAICEVFIDSTIQTQLKVTGKLDENGKLVSDRMENLYPFLPEEEIKSIMESVYANQN